MIMSSAAPTTETGQIHANKALIVQALVLLAVLAAVLFLPGPRGPFLAVPLQTQTSAGMVNWLAARGARSAGRGELEGSLIMDGAGQGLFAPALARGILLLPAPDGVCGKRRTENNTVWVRNHG